MNNLSNRLKRLEKILYGDNSDKIMIMLDTTEETFIPNQQNKKPRLRINEKDYDVKNAGDAERLIDKYLKDRNIPKSSNRLLIFKICNLSVKSFRESEKN